MAKIKLAQSNKLIGISGYFDRTFSNNLKLSSVLWPAVKARLFAAWITGPSSSGSEKGKPSSKASAPLSTSVQIMSKERSKVGSHKVTKGTNAPSFFALSAAN